MQPDAPREPADSPPAKGLPPVAPPSGRFIAQLFLVPGLIVTFAVLFIFGLNYLFVEPRDADYYLHRLGDANPDIRWRAAHDLAQELKRPESKLRSDPKFALHLAERLSAALAELKQKENAMASEAKASGKKKEPSLVGVTWLKLNPQRDYIQFLTSAMGDFVVPVGIPLLCAMALAANSPDVKGNTDQRRKAVWALGNLGKNLKSFGKMPAEQRTVIQDYLRDEAAANGPRAFWARTGLCYLDPKVAGRKGPKLPKGIVDVNQVLVRLARDDDPFIRRMTALVLNFWDSPLAEQTLLELTRDNGHGTLASPGD